MAIDFKPIDGRAFSVDESWQRSHTRRFRAITDDPLIDGLQIYRALGLFIGMPYVAGSSVDCQSWVKSVKVDEVTDADGREWEVHVEYGPWVPQAEDPRENPTEVDLNFVEFEEPLAKDAETGAAVVNSAGDLYADPPLTRDSARAVLTVRRNEANYSLALGVSYANVVNDAAFTIGDLTFGPRQILCKPIVANRAFHSTCGFYWPTTYVFHMRVADTWEAKLLDRGFRRLVSGTRKLITNDDGSFPTEPPFLNGSGQPLAVGSPPVFRTFNKFPKADFSVFDGLF